MLHKLCLNDLSLPLTKIHDAPLLDRDQDQSDLQQFGVQNNLKNLNFTLEALRAINSSRRLGNEREMRNRVKTDSHHDREQAHNKQRSGYFHNPRLPLR
jgi:hypothetical protein